MPVFLLCLQTLLMLTKERKTKFCSIVCLVLVSFGVIAGVIIIWTKIFYVTFALHFPNRQVLPVLTFVFFSRPISRPPVYGAGPKGHAPHWCAWPGSPVRPALGRPGQGCARLGGERPWCLLHFWRWCGHKVPPQTRHGPHLSGPSGQCKTLILRLYVFKGPANPQRWF